MTAALDLTSSNPLSELRFLELSVPCDDVLHSLNFFKQLGFSALSTNDIWDYPYAVITDGRCFIGLHNKNHFEKTSANPRLSFVHKDIVPLVRHLHDNSYQVVNSELSDDYFQHTLVKATSKTPLHILAARSFSPPAKDQNKNSVLGYFRGIVLETINKKNASKYWNDVGLLVMEALDESHVAVSANNLNLLLHNETTHEQPGLLFEHPEPETLFEHFSRFGITLEVGEQNLVLGSDYLLKTPDGLPIWVRREQ